MTLGYWDKMAPLWRKLEWVGNEALLDATVNLFPDDMPNQVLEFGCGPATLALPLYQRYGSSLHYVGLDTSALMRARARIHMHSNDFPNAYFNEWDLDEINQDHNYNVADLIVARNVASYLEDGLRGMLVNALASKLIESGSQLILVEQIFDDDDNIGRMFAYTVGVKRIIYKLQSLLSELSDIDFFGDYEIVEVIQPTQSILDAHVWARDSKMYQELEALVKEYDKLTMKFLVGKYVHEPA